MIGAGVDPHPATQATQQTTRNPACVRSAVSASCFPACAGPAIIPPPIDVLAPDFEACCEDQMPMPSRSHDEAIWLRHLIATMDEGVVITDPQGRTTWINPGFTRLCGYTLAELRGQCPGTVLHGAETNPATVQQIRSALAQQHACTVDLLNYHKAGHPYWVTLHIIPLYDAAGRLVRFAATAHDITVRKRVEQDLRQQLVTVVQRVAQLPLQPDLITRCAWCQRIRDQAGQWQPVEAYLLQQGSTVSHGMCPTCVQTYEATIDASQGPDGTHAG